MPGGIQGESLLPAHASLAYSSTPAPWRLGLQKPWKLLLPKSINSSVFIYAMWGRKQDFLQNLPWFYNSCSVNKQKKKLSSILRAQPEMTTTTAWCLLGFLLITHSLHTIQCYSIHVLRTGFWIWWGSPLKKKGLPSLSRGCFSKIANTGSVYEGRRRQGGERRHMVVRNNNNNDLLHLFTAEAVWNSLLGWLSSLGTMPPEPPPCKMTNLWW